MSETRGRPDPDDLLARVEEEEARRRRGKLRVFLGFAPGVGKTYRMLQVARELAREHELDVVVGIVETHGRADTARLISGLEVLPRRRIEYRGRVLEELDLDIALARRPKVLLVDELAHTNAPGSRHPKRHQDVEELLEAGIDVLTTLNIQHLESLNDVVAQITGVRVREVVPDAALDAADGVEVVDISPEELLARLEEGKVYLPDQASRALQGFFRRGNLLALRELALRRTAQHVDDEVREYRETSGLEATIPSGERILVCVGPSPTSSRLIRGAARMSAGLRCPWVALYVETPALGALRPADQDRLDAHLRLAQSLGAETARLSAPDVAASILAYARRENVTRIVVGKPTHAWVWDRVRGSLLDEIVRGSGEIDVHVISGDPGRPGPELEAAPPARKRQLGEYVWALLAIVTTTLVCGALERWVALPDLEMVYLVAVMLVAVGLGRGPSIFASFLSVAAYDFFFVPPELTFAIADARYALTFATMFGVGVVVSELTARLRRQQRAAIAREERTAALHRLGKGLSGASDVDEVAQVLAEHVHRALGVPAQVLLLEEGDDLHLASSVPSTPPPASPELGVARWSLDRGRPAGLGTDTLPGARALALPLGRVPRPSGVLLVEPRAPLALEPRELLEAMAEQGSVTLDRARLVDEARGALLKAQTEELRSSLLSAVSHDLRTPLGTITGAASVLRGDAALSDGQRSDLLETIGTEAERLERLVTNLLDMTRLSSGAITVRREWVPLEEVVGTALGRTERLLGPRPIAVRLEAAPPLVSLDPLLLEQVFVNLLENVAKHAPPGTPVDIEARREGELLLIDVADRGPGFPPGAGSRVFDKFYRGPSARAPGAGLGLAICRGIVEAHGGKLRAADRPGGGALVTLALPLRGPAPPVSSPEAMEASA